jgi:hypothetical protein
MKICPASRTKETKNLMRYVCVSRRIKKPEQSKYMERNGYSIDLMNAFRPQKASSAAVMRTWI